MIVYELDRNTIFPVDAYFMVLPHFTRLGTE